MSSASLFFKNCHFFLLRRASNRRAPQAMLHLEQPFSHDKFNFTKINLDKEGIFELKAMEKGAKQQNK